MTAFLAIVKLTCKSLVRSRVFQLLLLLLLITVIFLPLSVVGDGTALAYIQVSLKYSLGAVGMILAVSTVWVGCAVMGDDVVSRRLHMVVSKPVRRPVVWLAKWTGVVVSHAVLLLFAAALVYAMVLWRFGRSTFSEKEKNRIRSEVLIGRRVFMPDRPAIDELTKKELASRLANLPPEKRHLTKAKRKELLWLVRKEVVASLGEVPPGRMRKWTYSGVDVARKAPLYLRYRVYVGKVSSENQRVTRGIWSVRLNIPADKVKKNAKKGEVVTMEVPRTSYPEEIPCGVFSEVGMNRRVVSPSGGVSIAFANYDPQRKPLFFQPKDGPELLVPTVSFINNYFRGVLVLLAKLAFLAGVACAVGGVLSTPVAIFVVVSYLLAGSFSAYLVGVDIRLFESSGVVVSQSFIDGLGNVLSRLLLVFIIPVQNFEVSGFLANGELISWKLVARIVFFNAILRGVPAMAIGAWLYSRRELGLTTGK